MTHFTISPITMNPDPREHGDVRASSPPLPPFRAQAAPTDGLRQRHVSPLGERAPHMLRVQIQTPYADLGKHTHAWDAPRDMTVREAKDAIASGAAGYGLWERDGLRLVWRGRILRDDDALGNVLTDASPTLHLVARPINAPVRAPPNATPPPRSPTLSFPTPPTSNTPSATALADSVHYLLFAAREHLTTLIGAPTIRWDDMYPAPTVPRTTAKAAVISVIRPYAQSGRWVGWEAAFVDAGDWPALEAMWTSLGRDAASAEIRALWKSSTGRDFAAGGEVADVELDHTTFSLHVPPLHDMAPSQLIQLLQYLRVTTLIPPLSGYLSAAQTTAAAATVTEPAPTPTPTTPLRGITVRTRYRGTVTFRLPRVSFTLIQHQFWSAARLATIVWMLTRSMGWMDQRLWLLAGAAAGWWCVDGYNQWWAETTAERLHARRAQRRAEAQARLANPEAARARLEAIARGERVEPVGEENPLDPAVMAAGGGGESSDEDIGPLGLGGTTARQIAAALHLLHLDADAAQLRLPGQEQPTRTAGTPTPPSTGPALRAVPDAHPSFIVTHLLLPIYLWFLTLVPAFEARRARAIRARERAMRAVIPDINPAQGGEDTGSATPRPLMLPDGISPAARRYYARVAHRPEGIDWDEERDAQRAMGIPDEEREAGAGLALL